MIRALRYLILFLLPFVLYGVWILIARRRAWGMKTSRIGAMRRWCG